MYFVSIDNDIIFVKPESIDIFEAIKYGFCPHCQTRLKTSIEDCVTVPNEGRAYWHKQKVLRCDDEECCTSYLIDERNYIDV